jgi:Zn ribbon nucleic-acid-binding protein
MYDDQWREHDRRLSWLWLALGLGFAAFIGLAILSATMAWSNSTTKTVFVIWFVVYAIAGQVVYWRVAGWRCPRCGKQYTAWYNRRWRGILGIAPCVHCGLTRYSRDTDKRAALRELAGSAKKKSAG